MSSTFLSATLAWLLTYALHSTVLLSLAWLATRLRRVGPSSAELLWKVAMLGGIITASVQSQLDIRPSGTFSLAPATETVALHGVDSPPLLEDSLAPISVEAIVGPAPTSATTPASSRMLSAQQIVVLVWCGLAISLLLIYSGRRLILIGRLGSRQQVTDGPLAALLGELTRATGYRSNVRLTFARTISSPVALGWQEICVPEAALTDLDPEQQRGMLAHELAHLARLDPLWLTTASLIERIFFFQPLNRLARREIVAAAEFLSDEWAVRRTGSGLPLARCLARVAEWIQVSPLRVAVAGMAEERSLLVSRIERLLDGGPQYSARTGRIVGALAVVAVLATTLLAPRVMGQMRSETSAQQGRAVSNTPTSAAGASELANKPIVEALIARLADDDVDVRRAAAHDLGRVGDDRAVQGLITALQDGETNVRVAAADALGEIGAPAAAPSLLKMLADESPRVRERALDALDELHARIDAGVLIAMLGDPSAGVRSQAADMAGDRQIVAAIPTLVKLLVDANAHVRENAVDALADIEDTAARGALRAALGSKDSDIARRAAEALGDY